MQSRHIASFWLAGRLPISADNARVGRAPFMPGRGPFHGLATTPTSGTSSADQKRLFPEAGRHQEDTVRALSLQPLPKLTCRFALRTRRFIE